MTEGLIVNLHDSLLEPSSPFRTRFEERTQQPVIVLEDGCPVWEFWMYVRSFGRWFCMTKQPGALADVVYYDTKEELLAKLAQLPRVPVGA